MPKMICIDGLFETYVFAAYDGMLLEFVVNVRWIVRAVMRSAALFARQSRVGDQQRGGVYVVCLAGAPRKRLRQLRGHRLQLLDGFCESCSSAHDPHLVPHQMLHFVDDFLGIGGSECLGSGKRSKLLSRMTRLAPHGFSSACAEYQP